HPLNNLRVLRYLANPLGHDEKTIGVWYNHWIAKGFEALEAILAKDGQAGAFCHGEAPGLADICLVPQCFNAQRYKLDMAPYPTLRRIFENCMKLDAFENARPEKQPDAE
ncbi:MAG: glutathione S-transferase C-terminal domain-containing protein, partial [Alphaproteobacteria bacterium]|nr:glutathione S-transferase C-terminal domain-containing protein [Alphaproteobacteria bacterium]